MVLTVTESQLFVAKHSGACSEAMEVVRAGVKLGDVPSEYLRWAESLFDFSADVMPEIVEVLQPIHIGMLGHSGSGDGSGDGYGSGDGDGSGDGYGSGYGYGYGSGDGYG